MTAQTCPECHRLGFVWAEDDGAKTEWYCSRCQYIASETDARAECEECGEPGALHLEDEAQAYIYCLACKAKAPAE
jgi:hypothetical protein